MYTPLKIQSAPRQMTQTSTMASRGLNLQGLPELMKLDFAIKFKNYIPYPFGIATRRGLEKIAEKVGVEVGFTLCKYYANGYFIIGYANSIEAYNIFTDTFTSIKSDFSDNDRFGGGRYGDYFLVTNNVDKQHRISRTLAYDGQTTNFTVGKKVTGGDSGATAVILENSDSGASGTLTLGKIDGTFQDNEPLTDSEGGAAVVNGDVAFTITEITSAPVCADIVFIGPRAVAVSILSDRTAVQLSPVDDGSNPPFASWTIGTGATDGAIVNYSNAGTANSCVKLGQNYVVFSENGYFTFTLDIQDSNGTLKKVENVGDYVTDFGGARSALTTPMGVFYVNESGWYQMLQAGQTDVPYSRQQKDITNLLPDGYFQDANLDNSDIVYDQEQNIVLLTYAQGSEVNNKVLGYKITEEIQAIFEIDGWAVNRFTKYDNSVYASSSVEGKIFKCFSGWNDDGLAISTEYAQELPLQTLSSKHSLFDFYQKGFLSQDSLIITHFDIYDRHGKPFDSIKKYQWVADRNMNQLQGWGEAGWGEAGWGGDFDTSGMIECFSGCNPKLRRCQRIRVRVVSEVNEPHIINWWRGTVEEGAQIIRRNMQKIT